MRVLNRRRALDEPALDDERPDPLLFSQYDDVNISEKRQNPITIDLTCQECAVDDTIVDINR